MTENRHGRVVDVEPTKANGYADREVALAMLERCVCGPATVGADRAYVRRDFVRNLRDSGLTPLAAQHERGRRRAVEGRTSGHPGYRRSQCKLVEGGLGWIETVGAVGKLRSLGRDRTKLWIEETAAHNLARLAHRGGRRLAEAPATGVTRSDRRLGSRRRTSLTSSRFLLSLRPTVIQPRPGSNHLWFSSP